MMTPPTADRLTPNTLRTIVSLLNTRAAANRGEKLVHASATSAWLADQGLLPLDLEVSEAEWKRLLEFREGVHALLLTRRQWNEEAARGLNRTIQDAPLEVSITLDRTIRITSSERTFDGAFGKIVSLVVNGYFANQWKRIKVCANDECHKVFHDDSRSANRRWCSRRCGDLIRTRNFRRTERYKRR